MVAASDLGSDAERRGGSSPSIRTKKTDTLAEIDLKKDDKLLEAELNITLQPEDYENELDQKLKEYKKTAKVPGFRPGKTPKGVLKKMIGKDLKKEIVPQKVWQKIDEYLKENQINTLASPKVIQEPQEDDFQNKDEFTWQIKIGIRPEVEVDTSLLSNITQYQPTVDDKVLEENLDSARKEHGEFKELEKVEPGDEEQIISATWTEVNENHEPVEGGIAKDSHFFYKDATDKVREVFDNKKNEEEFNIEPTSVFEISKLAEILGIEENAAKDLHKDMKVKINKILKKAPAELNQSFFDQILGEGEATTEDEFRKKYRERLQEYFNGRAEVELLERMRKKLLDTHDFSLPENFIWQNMKEDNQKASQPQSDEEIEKEFNKTLKYGRWSVIAENVSSSNNMEVTTEEIIEQAKKDLQDMISNFYGFSPDPASDEFQNVLKKYIEKEENYQKAYAQVRDNKVLSALKEQVETQTEELSVDEFRKKEEETFAADTEEPTAKTQ